MWFYNRGFIVLHLYDLLQILRRTHWCYRTSHRQLQQTTDIRTTTLQGYTVLATPVPTLHSPCTLIL